MTNGQIQQVQDLSKCYMPVRRNKFENSFVFYWFQTKHFYPEKPMDKSDKAKLRRLTHKYRHQIAAIRRNAKAAV